MATNGQTEILSKQQDIEKQQRDLLTANGQSQPDCDAKNQRRDRFWEPKPA